MLTISFAMRILFMIAAHLRRFSFCWHGEALRITISLDICDLTFAPALFNPADFYTHWIFLRNDYKPNRTHISSKAFLHIGKVEPQFARLYTADSTILFSKRDFDLWLEYTSSRISLSTQLNRAESIACYTLPNRKYYSILRLTLTFLLNESNTFVSAYSKWWQKMRMY